MTDISCSSCGVIFTPRLGGYNARYCSDRCKRAAQRGRMRARNPQQMRAARARSYGNTKIHPERMARVREQQRSAHIKVQSWLSDYKLSRGCIDCGYKEHAAALHLDHEGPKSAEFGRIKGSIKTIQAEMRAQTRAAIRLDLVCFLLGVVAQQQIPRQQARRRQQRRKPLSYKIILKQNFANFPSNPSLARGLLISKPARWCDI